MSEGKAHDKAQICHGLKKKFFYTSQKQSVNLSLICSLLLCYEGPKQGALLFVKAGGWGTPIMYTSGSRLPGPRSFLRPRVTNCDFYLAVVFNIC